MPHQFFVLALLLLSSCMMLDAVPAMAKAAGSTIFYTRHSDSQCLQPYYDTMTPSYVSSTNQKTQMRINTCLQAKEGNVKLTCKTGANKFTLMMSRYTATDTACSVPLGSSSLITTTIIKHEYVCQKDKDRGGYLKIHCGEDGAAGTRLPALRSPALYSNPTCSITGSRSRKILLNRCTPFMYGKFVAHYFLLSEPITTAPLSLRVTRYDKSDSTCTRRIVNQKVFTYSAIPATAPAVPDCLPDPLFKGYFYSNTAASATTVNLYDNTASTPQPSVAPTPLPSVAPTPLPSYAPTPLPSAAPAPVISGAGGYSIQASYFDSQCATSAIYTDTFKLGVCRIAGMGEYFLTNKVDDNLITTTYTDSACTVYAPPTAAPTQGTGGGMGGMGSLIPAPSVALNSCVLSFGQYTMVSWAQTVITTPATTTAGTRNYFVWSSSSDCTAQESNWIFSTSFSSQIVTVSDGQYCILQGSSNSLLATCPTGGATAGYNTVAYNTGDCSGPAGELTSIGACVAVFGGQHMSQTLGGCSAAPPAS